MQVQQPSFDDIYDVWVAPWWLKPEVYIALFFVVILLIVLLYIAWRFVKKRSKKLCPYEQLIFALETLRKKSVVSDHDYAIQLGILLRNFITQTMHIDCRSYTDIELGCLLEKSLFDGPLRKALSEICYWSLQPKFSLERRDDLIDRDLRIANLVEQLRRFSALLLQEK